NALMMQGRLQDAVGAYVQALRARPGDTDAKRNLELALRMLQQQKKQQQQQQQNDKNPQQNKPEPQPSPGEDNKPKQKKPGEMSEDEARQVLQALQQEEREGIKKHARALPGDRKPPEEDW